MNMRKTGILAAALLVLGLGACGSDDDAFQTGSGPAGAAKVASVTVITDTPTIPSSGLTPANISVLVRDTNNQFLKEVPVQFSASSGGLTVTSAVTDANGIAHATLSPSGDSSNRSITVTAQASGQSGQVSVAVTGTTVSIQGPDSLVTNTAGNYEAIVVNSAGNPVAGQTVTLTSAPAATFSASTVTTDANGRAAFTMTPTTGTSVTLTAAAAGTNASKAVSVSTDSFSFTSPAANAAFGLSPNPAPVAVTWSSAGVPVVGGTVTFSTTRGTIAVPVVTTNASGVANATLTSTTAGEAVVTATNNKGSTQRKIVFVAANASQIDLQANPFTVNINQSSTITAVVRDPNNNLVAGRSVVFGLSDPTGGSLSVGTAVTDGQGRASTVYSASSTSSATNGVHITATVSGVPSATDTVDLTVAGSPLFLSFGTGNKIEEINNDTQYKLNYVVQVTDSNGAGVAGVSVSLSALSWNYVKGFRYVPLNATTWSTQSSTLPGASSCMNEDRLLGNAAFDFNGILDLGEDANSNGSLQSGNIATIVPGSGTTDANGFLNFSIYYPQEYAYYLSIVLRARTAVQGTEFIRQSLPFDLPGVATDFNNINVAPPGMTSPFGTGTSCSNPN